MYLNISILIPPKHPASSEYLSFLWINYTMVIMVLSKGFFNNSNGGKEEV